MRPLFHVGERESSRIVLGVERSLGKNKSQSFNLLNKEKNTAKLNVTAEFSMER